MPRRALAWVCLSALIWSGRASAAAPLSKADALKLTTARTNGDPAVSLAVMTAPGNSAAVARLIAGLGGRIVETEPRLGFLSVMLAPDRVGDLALDASVQAIALDGVKGVDAPIVELAKVSAAPFAQPLPASAQNGGSPLSAENVAADHALLLEELDARRWLGAHPTFDGRGVTVAHVESAPDFLVPELRFGRDGDGRVVDKFRDVVSIPSYEPQLNGELTPSGSGGWRWVKLSAPQRPVGGSIEIAGRRYRVPDGRTEYQTGVLAIPTDVLGLAGIKTAATGPARRAVLWDGRRAWLDQDDDGDFNNDMPVPDFGREPAFGVLGKDDPATEVRESLGYSVRLEKPHLSFTFGMSGHASGVAGFIAASKGDAGRIEGVAPGARLISISHANTISSFAKAVITAFAGPADVILLESQYPTLGSHDLQDSQSVLELLLQRLIATYDKPCLITAGNDPGLGSIWDPTPAAALDIGAFQSAGATQRHYGLKMSGPMAIHWATSEGPTGTGALKPDLIAPVLHLSTSGGFEAGGEFPGLYRLPPGYQVFLGTSGATPVAAGAVALLVSAAKQVGAPHGAAAVTQALRDSAQFHAGIPAHQQGVGSIDVAQAWEHLRAGAARPDLDIVEVRAPLRTGNSAWIKPSFGPGLYESAGWAAGRAEDRSVLLTRRSGSAAPKQVTLSWVGDAASVYSGPSAVVLPLGETVPLKVHIAPRAPGAFSAILELRERDSQRVLARVPFTIVVPETTTNGTVSGDLTLERPGRQDVFIDVPPLADALEVNVDVLGDHTREPDDAFVQVLLRSPDGLRSIFEWADPATQKTTIAFDQPVAGTWQLNFLNLGGYFFHRSGETAVVTDHIRYKTAIIRAGAATGDPSGVSRWSNMGAPIDGGVLTTSLGRRSILSGKMGSYGYRMETINVAAGADLLILDLPPSAHPADDVDVYLFNPVERRYLPYRKAEDRSGGARIAVRRPQPGPWRVVVDGAFVENPKTPYALSIIQTSPRNGALVTDDVQERRETGETWSVATHPTVLTSTSELVSVAYVAAPDVYSLHEAELSKRPFVLLHRHAEPVLIGLRVTPVKTDSGTPRQPQKP